ncbi:MAG: VOC family protein [Acetobacteraceae bacterium]
MTARALRLLRVGRTVADLSRASAFYHDVLGFTVGNVAEADPAWAELLGGAGARVLTCRLRLGQQELELAEFDPPGAPYPSDSTAADLWFQHIAIVTPDMDAAYRRLAARGVAPITRGGPQHLPPSTGGVMAFKFRDPDGHPLELIQFPPGTGDPVWQEPASGALTIGFDHSALSIADAARSIGFYTGVLDFALASQQVNRGPEQDCLDGLGGVAVDVVALRPMRGQTPHVELLGYRRPRGRAASATPRPSDIAADRLIVEVEGLAAILEALRAPASGIVTLADGAQAALVRDPDGHSVVLEAALGNDTEGRRSTESTESERTPV